MVQEVSLNHYEDCNMRIKKGSNKNRGYIGYHTTWDDKRVFLRSKCEFIYARVLDKEQVPYLMERMTYKVEGRKGTYKPDFFIYEDDTYTKLIKIVETKGLDDKTTALKYKELYTDYFSNIGIEYEVIWKYIALITQYDLESEIEDWIQRSLDKYDFISDSRGENNPMYGKTHSDETKRLIGEKAKKRMAEEGYAEEQSKKMKDFYNTPEGMVRRREISKKRKEQARLRKLQFDKNNPIRDFECKHCNKTYKSQIDKTFCCTKCNRAWKYSNIEGYGLKKKIN